MALSHCLCFCLCFLSNWCFKSRVKTESFQHKNFDQKSYEQRLVVENDPGEKPAHIPDPNVILAWQKEVLKETTLWPA